KRKPRRCCPLIIGTPSSTNVETLILEPKGPIAIFFAMSSILTSRHSPIDHHPRQPLANPRRQRLGLGELLFQLCLQGGKAFGKRRGVFLRRLNPDIAAGG